MRSSLSFSLSSIFDTGMPVHFETTSATSSSVTLLRSSLLAASRSPCSACASRRSSSGILPYWSSAMRPRSDARRAFSSSRARALELFLDVRLALHGRLLGLPDLFEVGVLGLELVDLAPRGPRAGASRRRRDSFFNASRSILSWISRRSRRSISSGLRVHLHADARRGLVDEVDRLVGQLPVADVAVRQRRGGDDRGIRDLDLVMHRVALLEAAQDRDRVLDRRLVDEHLLEAALERRVLLDVLAVLVERRRADAVQLAARERGLQHVAGVHRAFGLAGADHRVQLVDEQDDLAFLLREIVQHALQALLELAAELRAGDQRAHVERQHALVLRALGHLAVHDALRETFDDGGLADAGLADQHGVVLRAALQHLDRAADLVVAADHGVELLLLGARREVDRVLLERLALLLGVLVVDLAAAANLVDGLRDRAFDGAGLLEDAAEIASSTARPRARTARSRCSCRRAPARACR